MLFRENAYLQEIDTYILDIDSEGWIEIKDNIFYAEGGGQPSDTGWLWLDDGQSIAVLDSQMFENQCKIRLDIQSPYWSKLEKGTKLKAQIDFQRRYGLMKMHTVLHLICSLVPCHVNGCQIGEAKSRIDFFVGDYVLNREEIEEKLNQLIYADYPCFIVDFEEAYLEANPDLVRTMSVKPPKGKGRIRFLQIGESPNIIDLQPCGGTHVKKLGEIGKVKVGKIESKGAGNKRIYLHLE